MFARLPPPKTARKFSWAQHQISCSQIFTKLAGWFYTLLLTRTAQGKLKISENLSIRDSTKKWHVKPCQNYISFFHPNSFLLLVRFQGLGQQPAGDWRVFPARVSKEVGKEGGGPPIASSLCKGNSRNLAAWARPAATEWAIVELVRSMGLVVVVVLWCMVWHTCGRLVGVAVCGAVNFC